MSWRMKLADWISGGELSRVKDIVSVYKESADSRWDRLCVMAEDRWSLQDALRGIAAMETPRCANIGKRMAKVAREAVE